MPLFTVLGLVLSSIKLAMDLAAWVKAHPEVTASVRETFERAHFTLSEIHADVAQTLADRDRTEAP